MKEFSLFVGIDVSKERLDVAVRPTGETWQVPYDAEGISSLTGCLRDLAVHLVVVEATGGMELALAGEHQPVAGGRDIAECGWGRVGRGGGGVMNRRCGLTSSPRTGAAIFTVRPCILNMAVIDRFVLGLEDRGSAGSSRPANSEPEQLNGPYEPGLGKVGPESGKSG